MNDKLLLAAAALAFAAGGAHTALAQTTDPVTGKPYVPLATDQRYQAPKFFQTVTIDKYKYDLPEGATKNLDAVRALISATDALGMLRQNAYVGAQYTVLGSSTNQWTIFATGTMNGQPVNMRMDWDHRVGAARLGVNLVPGIRVQYEGDAKRKLDGRYAESASCKDCKDIVVAAGDLSWDESKIGVFKQVGKTSAAERLLPVYLMPPASIMLGAAAADTIKLADKGGGLRELTIPVPQYKTDLKTTLNAKGEIVQTQMTVGGKVYTYEFSGGYENDVMDYHASFPRKIVEKVDGTVVADLTVTQHQVGRYMIWPTPAELKSVAQK